MELTAKQQHVLWRIVKDIRAGSPQVTLGGYAGTGKTTLAKYISRFFPGYAICAYTGKAAAVLRRKGMDARTIHSLIYRPVKQNGKVVDFALADPSDLTCKGFIVDEGSMVSRDIYDDLRSYGRPMIIIGDHGQLEPVGSDFNLMQSPDYTLEEIHRNAGPIARFAELLRFGKSPHRFPSCDQVRVTGQRQLGSEDYLAVDQVICAFNATRVQTNAIIREAYGYDGLLNVGERVMCLKNNHRQGLFNGMQGVVRDLSIRVKTRRSYMTFEANGVLTGPVWYDTRYFGQERPEMDQYGSGGDEERPNPFDYAYCITAHKSQGDEFDRVCVIAQRCNKWDHDRWAYTAASRAKQQLIWAI